MDFGHYQRREGKEHASGSSSSDRSPSPEKDRLRQFHDPHNPYGYEIVKNNPDSAYNLVRAGRDLRLRGSQQPQPSERRELGRDLHLGLSEVQPELTRTIDNTRLGVVIRNIRYNHLAGSYTMDEFNQTSREHNLNIALVRTRNFDELNRKMDQWRQSNNRAMKAYAQDFFRLSRQDQD